MVLLLPPALRLLRKHVLVLLYIDLHVQKSKMFTLYASSYAMQYAVVSNYTRIFGGHKKKSYFHKHYTATASEDDLGIKLFT